MNTRMRAWTGRILKAVIVVAITWGLFRATGLDLAQIDMAEIERLNPSGGLMVLSFVGLVAMYLWHAMLWRRIVTELSSCTLTRRRTIRVYFLANLGKYIPGKFWQVAGLAVLAGRAGVQPVVAVASALLGQLAFLVAGLAIVTALVPGALDLGPLLWLALAAMILAGGIYAVRHLAPVQRIVAGLGPRFVEPLRDLARVAAEIRVPQVTVWFVAYLATWLLLGAAFTVFVSAFVPLGGVSAFPRLAGIMAASYLAGYVAIIAPAGVGVREGVMGLLLAQLMPAPAAVIVAVASRIWFTLAELAPVAAIPFLDRKTDPSGEEQRSERLVAL
ncbi:MAG TPA: hypothetical protein VNZ57_10130 [Longimicrobiales bacterium]|nr:hypothetical protein [Longimicrobiales bacterium]